MRLSELLGDATVDAEAAARHLEFMFEADDLVHVTGLREKNKLKGKQAGVITMGGTRDELCEQIRTEGLQVIPNVERENPWNVYYSIAPATEIVQGLKRRPGKAHAAQTRQLFADIDCKPGGFDSEADIRTFIENLPLQPSCVSWTGSGGCHLSWLIAPEDRELFTKDSKAAEKWWSWLMEHAPQGVAIDHLIDPESRVLRLAGTVRFPKATETAVPQPVRAEYTEAPALSRDAFNKAVREPYKDYAARVKARRAKDRTLTQETIDHSGLPATWGNLAILADVDAVVADELSWDDVLVPMGWTFYKDGGDGSREWTRPGSGANSKSATTDWPDSPEVMSLFSADEDTGLWDLEEAEVPLTKWRVYLRLHHNDNVKNAIEALAAE